MIHHPQLRTLLASALIEFSALLFLLQGLSVVMGRCLFDHLFMVPFLPREQFLENNSLDGIVSLLVIHSHINELVTGQNGKEMFRLHFHTP